MAFVWEQRKLGEVADIVGGGTPSTNVSNYWDGNIDWYAPAEISDQIFLSSSQRKITEKGYNNSSAKMLPIGTVLFTSRAGIGKTAILSKKGCTNQGFQSIVPHKDELDSYFIFSRTDELKRYGEIVGAGSTFVEVSGKQMANIEMMMPKTISEQKVIGAYFAKLDHLITLHQRKRMLRKCFFSIDWEQRKLGDVLETIKDGTHGTHQDANEGPLLLSAKNIRNGTIIWDESDRRISINEYEKIHSKFKLKKNDVLLTIVGSIGETAILKDISGITFQRSVAFLRTSEQITPEFLCSEIQTQQFQKKLNDRKSTSAQPGIYLGDLSEIPFVYSKNKDEQVKIGQYFSNLDKLITLHQCKSNFCKKNEVNAWEQRKFGSLLNEIREKTTIENEDTLLSCAIDGMYLNSELFSHFRGQSNIGYLKVKKNDLILSAQNLHLGNCNVNLRFEHGIISPAYKVYELVDCNPLFVQAWIKMDKTKDFFLKSSTEGASVCRKNILWEELYKQELVVPAIEEQTVIGTYFEQFDQLITLHQWECNINENTEGNDEKQRKPIKKLIISEGNLSLVDDMFLLHRMTFLVCNKYILLRLNVVKYKITIIIISNILYSIVSLLIIACYLIVINKQLIILIYVEISVVIIKGDDDYARIRS